MLCACGRAALPKARALHTSAPRFARTRGARAPPALIARTPPLMDVDLEPGGDPSASYVGAVRVGGKWTARSPGKTSLALGTFDSAKAASDAYTAAAVALGYNDDGEPQQPRARKPRAADAIAAAAAASAAPEPAPAVPVIMSSRFVGVVREGVGATQWEAVIDVSGVQVSGGEYEAEEDAARAYDALARMYRGAGAVTNFPLDPYTAWVPPEEVLTVGQIPPIPGVRLTTEEIVSALKQERGIDVRVIPLAGRSDLAEHLIFVTGRSPPHMRRLADLISRALRKRCLPGVDATPEGREMDDWIVVDCGDIIVNIMDAEAREVFALEAFYENMKLGVDPYAGMSYDEWLAANPIPDKWLARLERDEQELEARQRMPSYRGAPSATTARAMMGSRAPGTMGGGHHFTARVGLPRRTSDGPRRRAAVSASPRGGGADESR